MTTTPEVSVVMPCHRGDELLRRSIQSCLDQTLANFERVILLHRADEKAKAIAGEFVAADERIVLTESNLPFTEALNAGHERTSAGLVARMDSDDFAYPDRLTKQAEFLHSNPGISAVSSLIRIVDAQGNPPAEGFAEYEKWLNGLETPDDIAAQRFIESPIANPTVMFRREVFEEVGGYRDLPWAEDYDFYLRLFDCGHAIGKVPEVLLDWTDHEGRLTRTHDRYSQENFLRAKAHFLAKLELVKSGGISLCGAGPIGKQLAIFLKAEGVSLRAFYEVHPRRIGETIHGVPVLDQSLLTCDGSTLVNAVGIRGKRNEVRQLAKSAGFHEGVDFFCAA